MLSNIFHYFYDSKLSKNQDSILQCLNDKLKKHIMEYYILHLTEELVISFCTEDWKFMKKYIVNIKIYAPLSVGTCLNALDFGKGKKNLLYLDITGNPLVCQADIMYLSRNTKIELTSSEDYLSMNMQNVIEFQNPKAIDINEFFNSVGDQTQQSSINISSPKNNYVLSIESIKKEKFNKDFKKKCKDAISVGVEKGGLFVNSATTMLGNTTNSIPSPFPPINLKLPELPSATFWNKIEELKSAIEVIKSLACCYGRKSDDIVCEINYIDNSNEFDSKNKKYSINKKDESTSRIELNEYPIGDLLNNTYMIDNHSNENRSSIMNTNIYNSYEKKDYTNSFYSSFSSGSLDHLKRDSLKKNDNLLQKRKSSFENLFSMCCNNFQLDMFGSQEYSLFEKECKERDLIQSKTLKRVRISYDELFQE